MKKTILVLILTLVFLLAFIVVASAEENVPEVTDTYYIVSDPESELASQLISEGKKIIGIDQLFAGNTSTKENNYLDNFAEKSHIELIFAESITHSVEQYKGLLLNKEITISVRYNGFSHKVTNNARENVFVLRHASASIRFYGSNGLANYTREDIANDTTNYYSSLENDISHGKVYCWVYDGNAYAENMKTSTGEEFIYTQEDDNKTETSVINTYEYKNCYCLGNNSVGLLGKGDAPKIVKMDNCYVSGTATVHTICSGSSIKNTYISKFYMDCWNIEKQLCEFENSTIDTVELASGRTHVSFKDCIVDPAKIKHASDGGGNSYALFYTSAKCESAGSLKIYKNGSATTPIEGDSNYSADFIAAYTNENPALGHEYIQGEVNNNYCPMGSCFDATCSRCEFEGVLNWTDKEAELKEHSHTVMSSIAYENGYLNVGVITYACDGEGCTSTTTFETGKSLLTFLGYSRNATGTQVCVGYSIDNEMLEQIKGINTSFQIGLVAAVESVINTNAPLIKNDDTTISTVSKNVVKAAIDAPSLSRVDLKIIGDFAETYVDLPLLMSAYVYDGEKISYVYDSTGNGEYIDSKTFVDFSYGE